MNWEIDKLALRDEIERLRAYVAKLESEPSPTEALAEVERLRGLVSVAEWRGYYATCPWCRYDRFHAGDCPAFSARGEVRR